MLNYIWPLALVVLSNVFYQISAKSVPDAMNPFASLTITYLVGAAGHTSRSHASSINSIKTSITRIIIYQSVS